MFCRLVGPQASARLREPSAQLSSPAASPLAVDSALRGKNSAARLTVLSPARVSSLGLLTLRRQEAFLLSVISAKNNSPPQYPCTPVPAVD